MKNIVFIVNSYYPNFSAIGSCIKNVIEEMYGECNIIVISKKNEIKSENVYYNNTQVRYIDTYDNFIRNSIAEHIKYSKGMQKSFFKAVNLLIRGYGYLGALLKKRNIKYQEVNAIFNELISINEKIDVIIPTCLPFESIIASIRFKNCISNETKVIPFLFDKFSANSTLHRTEFNKQKKFTEHISMERQMFEKCEKLIFVESWKEHLNLYFKEYKNKFIQVEHPLLRKIESIKKTAYNPQCINIVYTGALYKKIRSPINVLRLFAKLIEEDNRLVMHFYVTGDCDSIVKDYNSKYPQNIMYYGKVKSDVAKSAIVNADILISIGNTDITQLPSKIFEYISTGSPVIHFYSKKEDPVIEILDRYKNSLCVWNDDKNTKDIEANLIEVFNNRSKKMQFNEIENIYKDATPKYTANIIMNLIND